MNRLFAALLLATAWLDAHAQSSLPQCPKDIKASWTNCFGTVTFEEGEFKGDKYVGEFRDRKFHGQGTYTFGSGDKYVGELRDGKNHGQGTYTFVSGDKYVGEYRDGKNHGQGTYTFANGDQYVGEYRDDKYHGQGTYTFASGEKYVGEFRDGKSHGQGTHTFADGSKYVGEFRDDKSHGQGTYTFADGSKHVGEYRYDKRNGQGIQYSANGTIELSGVWANDAFSQAYAIDTGRFPFSTSSGVEVKDPPTREPRKRTSVEIVNDCLAKGLKPGTSQFSKCVSGQ